MEPSTLPQPLEAGLYLKGEMLLPEPVRPVGFTSRVLGKIGLKSTLESETQRNREQRFKFLHSVVDRMGRGNYDLRPVTEYPIELVEEDYIEFGFLPEEFSDSELEKDFHKENDPSLDVLKQRDLYDWYRVVEDEEGNGVFLKTANKNMRKNRGLLELNEMARHLPEVFASRIAAQIGYPVPETRPVLHDGKPWVASPFIQDHISYESAVQDTVEVSNPSAIKTRTIFNMLVGSVGDNAYQGVVDPSTGTYYAQDVSMHFFEDEVSMTTEEVKNKFMEGFDLETKASTGVIAMFGTLSTLSPEDISYARNFLQSAQNISATDAQEMFAYGQHEFKDSENVRKVLVNRATALIGLLEAGDLSLPTEQ